MQIEIDDKLVKEIKANCKKNRISLKTKEQLENKVNALLTMAVYDIKNAKDVESVIPGDDNYFIDEDSEEKAIRY